MCSGHLLKQKYQFSNEKIQVKVMHAFEEYKSVKCTQSIKIKSAHSVEKWSDIINYIRLIILMYDD